MAAPSFQKDIYPLFTSTDVAHMMAITGGKLNLHDYNSVKTSAQQIYQEVSSHNMPPGNPWPPSNVQLFQSWMNNGMPP